MKDFLVMIKTEEGKTLMHLASEEGLEDIMSALLGEGEKCLEEDNNRRMPLHQAILNTHTKVAIVLIRNIKKQRLTFRLILDNGPLYIVRHG